MALTQSHSDDRQTVLVLQGGGALGAYQGGVYEELVAHGVNPNWVVGTSIGAINCALIAGNPPERRLARLKAFWDSVAVKEPLSAWYGMNALNGMGDNPFVAQWLAPWAKAGRYVDTVTCGIPGFFEPRGAAALNITQQVPTHEAGFYDTSPLHATLERLVDFDYLNEGHVRCTVCAVEVATGELVVFDSAKHVLTAKHIMASGALPPGFPPVVIDGKAYWDGGVYSNTPVDILMDDAERRDTLCFMVDLWDPTEREPQSISEAMVRQKDIQYASRTREHLEDHRTMQNLRRAIDILSSKLPAKDRQTKELGQLTRLGCHCRINIVRLIMKALPDDDHNKDIDFASASLKARWAAGVHDAERALAHRSWLAPHPDHVGMVVHELKQEEKAQP